MSWKEAVHEGGSDERPSGDRPIYHEYFYAAFARDPEGNGIRFLFCEWSPTNTTLAFGLRGTLPTGRVPELALRPKALYIIQVDGKEATLPRQVKASDTEKVTINLGYVDLGRIDLLVEEGFYTNRTDFIRAAIRAQLGSHSGDMTALIERRVLDIGLRDFTRADLEAARDAGELLHIKVVGLARLASDIDAELALATIGSINVLGALQASPEVKDALGTRIS